MTCCLRYGERDLDLDTGLFVFSRGIGGLRDLGRGCLGEGRRCLGVSERDLERGLFGDRDRDRE